MDFQRHPLSAKYDDIKGQAWEDFRENLRLFGQNGRKITLYEGQILDGWQLYRACKEEGATPEFAELPDGVDPLWFVQTANDHRRHESAEQVQRRAAERRERVAAARREGESLRTIADAEGVSVATVQSDLESVSTVQGSTVEPPNGEVIGKDKKKRKASGPKKPKKSAPSESTAQGCAVESENSNGAHEPATVPPCTVETAKPPVRLMDPFGLPVPEEHALTFAPHLEAIRQEAMTLCRKLGKLVNEYASSAAGEVFRRECKRTQKGEDEDTARFRDQGLADLLPKFEQLAPHCSVCPHCEYGERRKPGVACHCCEGRGWIHQQIFTKNHGMTPEMRTLLEERKEAAAQ